MQSHLPKERMKLLIRIEKLLEGPMIILGFIWLGLLIMELVRGLTPLLETISLIIWAIFIIDFLLSFIVAPYKIKFLKKNWLTAISLIIPAFRIFRLLRFLRLIRGVRVVKIVSSLNRSMRSLSATMARRGFGYVVLLTLIVIVGGAAGIYAIEKGNIGFTSYGLALWWTAMRVITAGSDYWPVTGEGRTLAFILALFGYAVFGYVTATLATFFIGRDAEEKDAPLAGAKEIDEIKSLVVSLTKKLDEVSKELANK